jgi:hypothetical protein
MSTSLSRSSLMRQISGRLATVIWAGRRSFPLLVLAFFLLCFACNRSRSAPTQRSAGLTPGTVSKASQTAQVSTLPAKAQSSTVGPDGSIRKADFEDLMEAPFLKSVHATNMHDACKGALRTGIEISTKVFGDLDGDGRDEAAVTAFSCVSGNGGPDLIAVFAMNPEGVVRELKIEPRTRNQPFKGRNPTVGLRGQMTVAIESGRMIEKFPIFKETDGGCCASGGIREFIYRWDGAQFVLDDVVDVAEQTGKPTR